MREGTEGLSIYMKLGWRARGTEPEGQMILLGEAGATSGAHSSSPGLGKEVCIWSFLSYKMRNQQF